VTNVFLENICVGML